MALKMKEIEEESLRLPMNERALLAEHLIQSLETEDDGEIERLWIEEAERRYQEYKTGRVKAKPADLVFQDIRSKLA